MSYHLPSPSLYGVYQCSFFIYCSQDVFIWSSISPAYSLHFSHISRASNISFSFLLIVQVSLPYNAILQTYVFMSRFFVAMFIFFDVSIFLFLRNVFFAWPILLLISLIEFPSSVIMLPKYLKWSTWIISLFSNVIFIGGMFFL